MYTIVIDEEEIVEGNESVAYDIIRAVDTLLSRHGFRIELEEPTNGDVPGKVKLSKV